MERFVTVDEFSSAWNPVRRCAQNRKILRQRENHVVCGGGEALRLGVFEEGPFIRTIMSKHKPLLMGIKIKLENASNYLKTVLHNLRLSLTP